MENIRSAAHNAQMSRGTSRNRGERQAVRRAPQPVLASSPPSTPPSTPAHSPRPLQPSFVPPVLTQRPPTPAPDASALDDFWDFDSSVREPVSEAAQVPPVPASRFAPPSFPSALDPAPNTFPDRPFEWRPDFPEPVIDLEEWGDAALAGTLEVPPLAQALVPLAQQQGGLPVAGDDMSMGGPPGVVFCAPCVESWHAADTLNWISTLCPKCLNPGSVFPPPS